MSVPDSATVADALRFVGLIFGGGSVGLSALVVVIYGRRYLQDRALARQQGQTLAWRGLLPFHVAAIGTAHTMLAFTAMQQVYEHLGRDLAWQTFTRSFGLALSAVALYTLLRWQRRIYPRHDESPPTPPLHTEEHSVDVPGDPARDASP